MINRHSTEKIYAQIANAIEADIRDKFEAGDVYSSEKVLSEKFGVNRHTIRRAIEELVKHGFLEKRHGFGTFVTEKKVPYRFNSHERLSSAMFKQNVSVETIILEKKIVNASGGVSEALEIKLNDEVFLIETLRKVEGQPACVISHFLPLDIYNNAFEGFNEGALGQYLIEEYGIKPKRVSSVVSAAMPTALDSFRLNLTSVMPILKVKTINEDEVLARKVEYSVTRFRADMFQLEMVIG